MDELILEGVDFTHIRLMELSRLADQAKPFYDWVEKQFQQSLKISLSLDALLQTCTKIDLITAMTRCYDAEKTPHIPFLFDGIGRTYSHQKACYYFFAWMIRDAPQQRLNPLIQRIVRQSQSPRKTVEIEVLASLIETYRVYVKTFSWEAVREIIIDRLEGSRRSLKGHEKETLVRTALITAFQHYFIQHNHYGIYGSIVTLDKQVLIENETYDVSIHLHDLHGNLKRRILVAIKTRETEGGGHAHLFSRDILSAINTAKKNTHQDYLIVVIIAKNWSDREMDRLKQLVDYLIIVDRAPTEISLFTDKEQSQLDNFIAKILNDSITPKIV